MSPFCAAIFLPGPPRFVYRKSAPEKRTPRLTKREQAMLRELTRNYTDEEIAARLNGSVNTVQTHIQHMSEKTGFRNRIELAVHARAAGPVVHENDRISGRA